MLPRVRDYQPGQRLPGTVYEVVRLIGAGGMGNVYDVEDTTIGKRYVLKTLHPQLGARDDLARRMQNEARTLARLNHANIVEVITAGVTGDDARLPYYVMERLNGQSLRVVLEKKGQLELPHAIHIGIDLLDALDHAHDKGVIHRDVKPDNIFLHRTPAGVTVTKLLDFGILSFLDSARNETGGRFLGTLRYAAPEQLRGETPTPQVDIYAAGLVLYEMIAGRGPFDDEGDGQAIGAAHLQMPAPPLSTFAAVPLQVEGLIMSALAKAPEARPRDAYTFAATLRELKRNPSNAIAREATTGRANTAAVIGQESAIAAYVDVKASSADGPYVVSPVPHVLLPGQTNLPKTTMPGFTPPTLGPSLAPDASPAPIVEAPGVVNRMAATSSWVPHTVANPRAGTEPLGESLSWPMERPAATSEELQVQTVSASAPRPLRWAARLVAALVMLAIGALAAVLVLMPSRRVGGKYPALPAAAQATTPAAEPAVLVETTQGGLADSATSAQEDPKQEPAKGSAARAGGAQHSKSPHAASKSSNAPSRTDRPGPGF